MQIQQVLIEAFVVGLATVLVGVLVQELLKRTTLKVKCTHKCDWNKNYIREISLFLTGFILHIAFEITGGNTWYCKSGSACKSLHSFSRKF